MRALLICTRTRTTSETRTAFALRRRGTPQVPFRVQRNACSTKGSLPLTASQPAGQGSGCARPPMPDVAELSTRPMLAVRAEETGRRRAKVLGDLGQRPMSRDCSRPVLTTRPCLRGLATATRLRQVSGWLVAGHARRGVGRPVRGALGAVARRWLVRRFGWRARPVGRRGAAGMQAAACWRRPWSASRR